VFIVAQPGAAASNFMAEAMDAQGGGMARKHPASKAAIGALASGTCTDASGAPSENCPICQDAFGTGDEWLRMPCSHFYHKDCLTPWLAENNTCPTCREEIESEPALEAPVPPADTPAPSPHQQSSTAPPGMMQFMHIPGGEDHSGSTGNVHPLQAMLAQAHDQMLAQEEERQLQAALQASLEEPQPAPAATAAEPSSPGGSRPNGDTLEPARMGVRQLKQLLEERGVYYSGCVERSDLLALIAQSEQRRQ